MNAPPLLTIANLHAGYGHVEVLRDVSLVVEEGAFLTIIGANGASPWASVMCPRAGECSRS
jgi:branched-chain amino acid transport system ATP-binding protein